MRLASSSVLHGYRDGRGRIEIRCQRFGQNLWPHRPGGSARFDHFDYVNFRCNIRRLLHRKITQTPTTVYAYKSSRLLVLASTAHPVHINPAMPLFPHHLSPVDSSPPPPP